MRFLVPVYYDFNLSIKRLPFPNSLSTERVPPCASTKSLDIDNPNPLPCTFVPGTHQDGNMVEIYVQDFGKGIDPR